MNNVWISKQGNKNCILFFNGWGMDEKAITQLENDSFDILMVNDYNPLTSITENLSGYQSVYLVAWSLGVWAATQIVSEIEITKAIALNGTQKPINDKFGIPQKVFDTTLTTWNEKNRERFNRRMFGGNQNYQELKHCNSQRETHNQVCELENIRNEERKNGIKELKYHCAIVGKQDMIFTPENQTNYWEGNTRIVEKEIPHFPFSIFKSWKEIIEM